MPKLIIRINNVDLSIDPSKTYYVAGPISGNAKTPEDIQRNKAAFTFAVAAIRQAGIKAVSPLEINANEKEDKGLSHQECMRNDIRELLAQCDGVIMLPGWPKSKGARFELQTAWVCGLEVHHLDPMISQLPHLMVQLIHEMHELERRVLDLRGFIQGDQTFHMLHSDAKDAMMKQHDVMAVLLTLLNNRLIQFLKTRG